MQRVAEMMLERAKALLADGTVDRVVGWEVGEFFYDLTPAVFSADGLDKFVYNGFSGANLSKYMIKESAKDGKALVFLKPCDTYSFNQLINEHRVDREKVYIIGVECRGMLDIRKVRDMGIKGITAIREEGEELVIDTIYGEKKCARKDALLEKCLCCKGQDFVVYDELLTTGEEFTVGGNDRFAKVAELEAMTPDERFAFWRNELSKCIRCNACRNVCPACSCLQCVFDNPKSGISSKANADDFEENMFHIIRAFHVAGRCTDCGECSRVCPQGIPLHLLNRKFIKDINEFYGEFQAGADNTTKYPLTNFTKNDVEPSIVTNRGGEN